MSHPVTWSSPFTAAELTSEEIHLWRASLDLERNSLGNLAVLLAPDEKARAEKFVFERDRNHFIAARGILRQLLARYVRRDSASLEFHYGAQGKPALRLENPLPAVRFNISHSGGLALFAFSLGRELGVDLEPIRSTFAGEELAERYFSAREVAELRALPPSLKAEGFFLCWTRKEAYVKARGEGLQIPLKSFSVSLTPGDREALQSSDESRWKLRSFEAAPGYTGAIAAEGQNWRLRFWEWMDGCDEQKV